MALAGCSGLRVDPAADQQGWALFRALQRGDWRALEPRLSPVIARDPDPRPRLERGNRPGAGLDGSPPRRGRVS